MLNRGTYNGCPYILFRINCRYRLPENVDVGADNKPSSVLPAGHPIASDDHSSGTSVAWSLKRHYPRTSDGPPSIVLLFGLAPDGVYQAFPVTRETGELLPRLFTLTRLGAHTASRRYLFCGTFLRVTPSRR